MLWEAYCGRAIPVESSEITKLGSTVKLIITFMGDNSVCTFFWPWRSNCSYGQGYYKIEFPHQEGTFDAFCITEDNRVIFFKCTAESESNNNNALCTSQFDELAEAMLLAGSHAANLVPFDCHGCPKPGAEWRLVWVVPENAKGNVKAAPFKSKDTAKFKAAEWEKHPLRCWDWAGHIQQYVTGLDYEKKGLGLLFGSQ
jgi:hypothetical protein